MPRKYIPRGSGLSEPVLKHREAHVVQCLNYLQTP